MYQGPYSDAPKCRRWLFVRDTGSGERGEEGYLQASGMGKIQFPWSFAKPHVHCPGHVHKGHLCVQVWCARHVAAWQTLLNGLANTEMESAVSLCLSPLLLSLTSKLLHFVSNTQKIPLHVSVLNLSFSSVE